MMAKTECDHATVTARELAADLRNLGVVEGSTVLDHVSLSRLGQVEGPLRDAGAIRIGPVGRSTSRLDPARVLAETLLPVLHADPLWLMSGAARAAFTAAMR